MTADEGHPKLPLLLPYNTEDFQRSLIWALDAEKNSTEPKTCYEIALELHYHVLENYLYMIVNTENPAHVWSCLSDLAAVASAYHVLDRVENSTTFMADLPEWIMQYLGKCAVQVHELIINYQVETNDKSRSNHSQTPSVNPKAEKNSTEQKTKEAPSSQRPKHTSRYITEKIPKAFDLAQTGVNRLSVAAGERQIFSDALKAKAAGLSRVEAAAIRKSQRRPDLMRDPTDEEQGDKRSELQRDLAMVGLGYRVWERRVPNKRRK